MQNLKSVTWMMIVCMNIYIISMPNTKITIVKWSVNAFLQIHQNSFKTTEFFLLRNFWKTLRYWRYKSISVLSFLIIQMHMCSQLLLINYLVQHSFLFSETRSFYVTIAGFKVMAFLLALRGENTSISCYEGMIKCCYHEF